MASHLQHNVVHVCVHVTACTLAYCHGYVCRIPLGVVSSLLLGVVWLSPYLEQPVVEGDRRGVVVFGVCAVIELTAEPLWVMAQINQHISLKVRTCVCEQGPIIELVGVSLLQVVAEGIPQLVKCVLVVSGVVFLPNMGLTIFMAAQVSSHQPNG